MSKEQSFNFKPHNYRTYSDELKNWLARLSRKRMIKSESELTPASTQKIIYYLSENNQSIIEECDINNNQKLITRPNTVIDEYVSLPILELMDIINTKYPEIHLYI